MAFSLNVPNLNDARLWILGGWTGLVLLHFLKEQFKKYLIERTTILNDIPLAGASRKGKRFQGTAVICGGSFAGLLAARVCSDHFEDVVIIESEAWLASSEGIILPYSESSQKQGYEPHSRARVTQYRSAHATQILPTLVLRRLFPNFDEDVKESGGKFSQMVSVEHRDGVKKVPYGADPPLEDFPNGDCPPKYVGSRESLEAILRRSVRDPKYRIRWIVGTVTGLQASEGDKNEIKSVVVRLGGDSNNEFKTIDAALVVDCTGTTQAGYKWLTRLRRGDHADYDDSDFSRKLRDIPRAVYDPCLRNFDFIFPVPPEMRKRLPTPFSYDELSSIHGDAFTLESPTRAVVIHWMDNHRIDIVAAAYGSGELPTHPSQLLHWFESMPVKHEAWLLETVSMLCENADEVTAFSPPSITSSWVQYHLAKDLPRNFVAAGDAVMRYSPALGQGISKSCIDAITLDRSLRAITSLSDKPHIPTNFSQKFFKSQHPRIEVLWNSMKEIDYTSESTIPVEGEKRTISFMLIYLSFFDKLLKDDRLAQKIHWYTRSLIAPRAYLLHPRLVIKVLFVMFRQGLGLA